MVQLILTSQSGASGMGGMVMAGSSSVPKSGNCHTPYAMLPGALGGLQALTRPFYKEKVQTMELKRIIRSLDQYLVHQRSHCLSLNDMN